MSEMLPRSLRVLAPALRRENFFLIFRCQLDIFDVHSQDCPSVEPLGCE